MIRRGCKAGSEKKKIKLCTEKKTQTNFKKKLHGRKRVTGFTYKYING